MIKALSQVNFILCSMMLTVPGHREQSPHVPLLILNIKHCFSRIQDVRIPFQYFQSLYRIMFRNMQSEPVQMQLEYSL